MSAVEAFVAGLIVGLGAWGASEIIRDFRWWAKQRGRHVAK